jgi:hypothetical protein
LWHLDRHVLDDELQAGERRERRQRIELRESDSDGR